MVVFSKDIGVKVCDSRSMHVQSLVNYAMKLEHDLLLIVLLMSGGRGRTMVLSYQYIPLGHAQQYFASRANKILQ